MAFPTTGTLDSFAGASGAASNWTTILGGAVDLDGSGHATDSLANTQYAWGYYNPSNYGPDSEAFATVFSVGADTLRVGVRGSGTGSTRSGYYVSVTSAGAWTLIRIDSGTTVTLASGVTQALSAGDSVGVRIVGTVLTAWYQPSGGSWTQEMSYDTASDATQYSAAGYLAIEFGYKSTKLDSFGGGTYVPSGGTNWTSSASFGITDTTSASGRLGAKSAAFLAETVTLTAATGGSVSGSATLAVTYSSRAAAPRLGAKSAVSFKTIFLPIAQGRLRAKGAAPLVETVVFFAQALGRHLVPVSIGSRSFTPVSIGSVGQALLPSPGLYPSPTLYPRGSARTGLLPVLVGAGVLEPFV